MDFWFRQSLSAPLRENASSAPERLNLVAEDPPSNQVQPICLRCPCIAMRKLLILKCETENNLCWSCTQFSKTELTFNRLLELQANRLPHVCPQSPHPITISYHLCLSFQLCFSATTTHVDVEISPLQTLGKQISPWAVYIHKCLASKLSNHTQSSIPKQVPNLYNALNLSDIFDVLSSFTDWLISSDL